MSPKDRIAVPEAECARLRAENESLRAIIQGRASRNAVVTPPDTPRPDPADASVRHDSPTSEKVALFRSLFRGREDTYPLRWESKTGRSGYSPACANEWAPSICEKPRIKCADCSNKAFLAVSDDAVYQHLSGRRTLGVYPILHDDTSWFVAADFDGSSWREDAMAYASACRELGIAACVEVSRSGEGAHVWTFFESPIAASLARQLASAAITRACARHRTLAFASYDRLFPSQDTLPKGGFGNLIALPLQRKALDHLGKSSDAHRRVVLATGRFIGEGFDDPRLDTLFLAIPISWRGTLQQYAGRLHRDHVDKQEIRIYDYVDAGVPTLMRMFNKRLRGYRAMGYLVAEDAAGTISNLPLQRL